MTCWTCSHPPQPLDVLCKACRESVEAWQAADRARQEDEPRRIQAMMARMEEISE